MLTTPNPTTIRRRGARRATAAVGLAVATLVTVFGAPATEARSDEPVLGFGGRLLRVSVEVEPGLVLTGTEPTTQVRSILGDYRSWIGGGDVRFQLVDIEPDIRVRIAPPAVVDARCAPLRTGGRLSCRNGNSVNINADRWNGATDFWTAGLDVYRAYLINHEIGHFLGYGHVGCPGGGQPAPVMQQQTKSLAGCVENGWPYPDHPPFAAELELDEHRASRLARSFAVTLRRILTG